jgi:hypothetical protein
MRLVEGIPNTGKTINIIVSNGKCFIVYDVINRLQQQNSSLILSELSSNLNTERKEGKLHNIFETSFDWKACLAADRSVEQKNSFSKNWITRHGGQVHTSILVKQNWLSCLNNMNIARLNIITQENKVFIP